MEKNQVQNFIGGEKSLKYGIKKSVLEECLPYLKVVVSLMMVLRLVDLDIELTMGFTYEKMDGA